MVGPWIQFLVDRVTDTLLMEGDEDLLSDIMFLAQKEKEGKLRQNDNIRTALGDGAILTANGGKDMYLASAKVNVAVTGTFGNCIVKLNINTVIKDTWEFGAGATAGSGITSGSYVFPVGFKVLAGDFIKLEVTSTTNLRINTEIQCFEETTGADPRLPAQTQGTATIVGGIAGSLGFLAKKEFDGKLVTDDVDTNPGAVGDGASLQASGGKDLYLAEARVLVQGAQITGVSCTIVLSVEQYEMTGIHGSSSTQNFNVDDYVFTLKGVKVAAGQIIKLEITAESGIVSIHTTLLGWEENTGTSPIA